MPGLPLAWRVETARHHESKFVAPLLDALHARGFRPETCAMDKGYDVARVYEECEERGVEPVVPLKGAKANQPALPLALGGRLFPRIPRHTERFRDLYARRVAVEREFGHLKHHYARPAPRARPGTGHASRRPRDARAARAGAYSRARVRFRGRVGCFRP